VVITYTREGLLPAVPTSFVFFLEENKMNNEISTRLNLNPFSSMHQ
jgi:hypothetical protein